MFSHLARWASRAPISQLDLDLMRSQAARPSSEAAKPRFLIGLSVGQGSQPTGVAVLEKSKVPGQAGSAPVKTYACRYLRRWPPHTTYPMLHSALAVMLDGPPLAHSDLIVEAGTSLSAVIAFLRKHRLRARMRPTEVKVSTPQGFSDHTWKVTKGSLIETARQVLQEERLVFDDQMPPEVRATTPPVQTIYQAMLNYPFNKTPAANEAFASRDGEYDDLVLAVALACWYGERYQRSFAISM